MAALAAHVAAAFAPGMTWFGVNELRFLPAAAWALVFATGALCVPGAARRALPFVRAAGDGIALRPARAALAWGAAAAALAWALPDRTAFVGDFLLREGAVDETVRTSTLFPQALPLDVLLHYRLAAWLAGLHLLDVNATARALGVLEAFGLGALGVELARALRLRGPAAAACAAAVTFTGALGLMTGYSKAFSEMCLLALAVAAFGVRAAREGSRVGALGLTLALGLALHRSALVLFPAALVALGCAAFDPVLRRRLARPIALAGLAACAAALVVFLPRIVRTATGFDVGQHFASEEVRRHGGLLAAAVEPRRLLDLANVMLGLTPLVPLLLLAADGPRALRTREGGVLVALWASCLALSAVLFPAQGTFRDWDVFAVAGIARAALAAFLLARIVDGAKARAWLAVSVIAVCLGTTALALWLPHDKARGLARVEAFMIEPPARSEVERSKTWDFLGASWMQSGRDSSAARAFQLATQSSRNPRLYLQWALALYAAGDVRGAQRVVKELVGFAPGIGIAWTMLGRWSWQLQDYPEAARAARAISDLVPNDAPLRQSAEQVEQYVRAWEDSVRASGAGAAGVNPRAR